MDTSSEDGKSVELYVRSLESCGTQPQLETVIERLELLERRGGIDHFSVSIWGEHVAPTSAAARTDAGEFVLDRVAEFTGWARENGVTLRSCFESTEVTHPLTGETYTSIILPVMCLAEFDGGDISTVVPHSDGIETRTVSDRLDELERERAGESGGQSERTATGATPYTGH